jgi:outer membrane protein OmpA-like peptidoglycan-associated protein
MLATGVDADDVVGSSDHPVVSRYADSEIVAYKQSDYDEYDFIVKKILRTGGMEKNLESTIKLEGKLTRIAYGAPPGRSTLEVFRNYEQALISAGFEVLYSCTNADCGGRYFNHARNTIYGLHFAENYNDQRYLAARLDNDDSSIAVSVYTIHRNAVGSHPDRAFTQLDVIESAAMQENMVRVDADAMADALATDGHIALYNIYFNFDSAELKAESGDAINEVASLLEAQPNLNLLVAGHTDGKGAIDYNQNLSSRRSESVVAALRNAGIDASRLTPVGIGMAAPVASNRTDDGRAKNRRVELVERIE